MTDKARILESTCQELSKTIENQLTAYHEINQRAVDLAKIDLLTVSVVVTGVSLSKLAVSLPLLGGLLSFLYALWSCLRIYEPRTFARGLGAESVSEIDARVESGLTVEEHYRTVMETYKMAIRLFIESHRDAKSTFRTALWSSMTAITFFAVVVVRRYLPDYPHSYDVFWLFLIPVAMLWGKDKYGDDRSREHGY